MLRRIGLGIAWGLLGYFCGALGGGLLVAALSSNTFDREMEAAMTGAFVTGPLLAVIAFVIGAWRGGKQPRGEPS